MCAAPTWWAGPAACGGTVVLVVRGSDAATRTHEQRFASLPPKNSRLRLACSPAPEERSHEARARPHMPSSDGYRAAPTYRPNVFRAPANSALGPSLARRPARSPARRAADEYPAEALVARHVPRALDASR